MYGSSDGVNCHTAAPGAPAGDTAGTPDPAVAVLRIVRPDGSPAATGEAGEIQARGPMTPLCHVGAPELDARYRTADGWVRTGDLGALDEEGRLRVLGRLKNVVIRGGHTISPAEVERELGTHPGIAEAVCVPVPDEEFGERLCACVRPVPGTPAPALEAVTAHLAARGLERRKFPEYLLVLDRMPLRPTGKVCRRSVTAHAEAVLGVRTPLGTPLAMPPGTTFPVAEAGDFTHPGKSLSKGSKASKRVQSFRQQAESLIQLPLRQRPLEGPAPFTESSLASFLVVLAPAAAAPAPDGPDRERTRTGHPGKHVHRSRRGRPRLRRPPAGPPGLRGGPDDRRPRHRRRGRRRPGGGRSHIGDIHDEDVGAMRAAGFRASTDPPSSPAPTPS